MNRALLLLALGAIPILSWGQPDEIVRRPEIRVGDSWTFRSSGLFGRGSSDEHEERVTLANDALIHVVAIRKSDGKELDASYTSEWSAVVGLSGRIYRPHSGVVRFPLRVGDRHEMTFETHRPRASLVLSNTTITSNVVAWETIEVPAGKFRAIRVEISGVFRPQGTHNSYPLSATLWYSPDVRRWVKQTMSEPAQQYTIELIRYKLNEN